jgi:hypothetical protein
MQTTSDTDFAAYLCAFLTVPCHGFSEMPSQRKPESPDYVYHFDLTADFIASAREEYEGFVWLASVVESPTATIPAYNKIKRALIRGAMIQPQNPFAIALFPWLIQMRRIQS